MRKADVWGRKPIFAVALAVLTLRGVLYPLSDNPYWLVGVQLLDGVGAGIFGALFPLVVADLTRGTGHFNVSQGAIATAAGLGGALSHRGGGTHRRQRRLQRRVPVSRRRGRDRPDRICHDDAGNIAIRERYVRQIVAALTSKCRQANTDA